MIRDLCAMAAIGGFIVTLTHWLVIIEAVR